MSFRGRAGWVLEGEPRWLGDDGDPLGATFDEAHVTLSVILVDSPVQRDKSLPYLREQLYHKATKGVRRDGIRQQVNAALKTMAYEEVCYWLAKCDQPRGALAFRLLFTKEVTIGRKH